MYANTREKHCSLSSSKNSLFFAATFWNFWLLPLSFYIFLHFFDIFYKGLLYGQEEVPEIEKETHRLAVVNMDWRYVKVCHWLLLCNKFYKSVAYLSDLRACKIKQMEFTFFGLNCCLYVLVSDLFFFG